MSGLTTMLNNPFYTGLMRLRVTGEMFQGLHEPLVSQHLFDQVQDVLHGRISHRGLRHNHLYRRDVVCNSCKYKLIGETQKGNVYYRCHTRSCAGVSVREEVISQALHKDLLHFYQFVRDHPGLDEILVLKIAVHRDDHQGAIAVLRMQREGCATRLSTITDAVIDGLIDRDIYLEKKAQVLRDQAGIDEKLAQHALGDVPEAADAVRYLELAKALRNKSFMRGAQFSRDLVRNVTSNFLTQQKNVEMQWLSPFNAILQVAKTSDGDPTACTHRTLKKLVNLFLPKTPPATSRRPYVQKHCACPQSRLRKLSRAKTKSSLR